MSTDKKSSDKCNSMLELAVSNNPRIQTVLDAIEGLGCTIPKNFIACRHCEADIQGGLTVPDGDKKTSYTPQIIVCENHVVEKESFESTVLHELVHAYDICRAKVDFKDCAQHACTEIRASSLSDECNILHEAFRFKLKKFAGGAQDCVRRRAILSLENNPNCKAIAEKAVNDAFVKCYNDEMPFSADKARAVFPTK
eukprot:gene21314-24183_t